MRISRLLNSLMSISTVIGYKKNPSGNSLQEIKNLVKDEFDALYYLNNNLDVAEAGVDPLKHYLEHGWREGRNPNVKFDTEYYLNLHLAGQSDTCPLIHYCKMGRGMGLEIKEPAEDNYQHSIDYTSQRSKSSELFDSNYYLASYPDIALAGIDPLQHYLEFGWREGRNPSPWFDSRFYIDKYDLHRSDICPLVHYVEFGQDTGVLTRDLYNFERIVDSHSDIIGSVLELVSHNPDIATNEVLQGIILPMFSPGVIRRRHNLTDMVSDFECLLRYLTYDLHMGLSPGKFYDDGYYRSQVIMRGLERGHTQDNWFRHWLKFGVRHRISPVDWYTDPDYLELNPDLVSYPDWPFLHLIRHGFKEGRRFHPIITLSNAGYPNRKRSTYELLPDLLEKHDFVSAIQGQMKFWRSPKMDEIFEQAHQLDPSIHKHEVYQASYQAPYHDDNYQFYSFIRSKFSVKYENVILTPFCKLGGADFVGGVLSHALSNFGDTILIRTDASDWERPDWFPPGLHTIDLSEWLRPLDLDLRKRVLYELIRHLEAKHVFNVNSRLAFETFKDYGARLSKITNIYCYYFCADRTQEGREVGYPIDYFANILPYLRKAVFDTRYLRDRLEARYCLSPEMKQKLAVLFTPTMSASSETCLAEKQLECRGNKSKPTIIWAGRLDKQKRFDLVLDISRAMPDVTFKCFGKAVLDVEPSREHLPVNLTLSPPFKSYSELPLTDCDGLLFTSLWEGMPTILLEFGAMGMPIIASSVGGVPELINDTTGWPIASDASVEDAIRQIRDLLSNPDARVRRAIELQKRVAQIYNWDTYVRDLEDIILGEERNEK